MSPELNERGSCHARFVVEAVLTAHARAAVVGTAEYGRRTRTRFRLALRAPAAPLMLFEYDRYPRRHGFVFGASYVRGEPCASAFEQRLTALDVLRRRRRIEAHHDVKVR